MKNKYQKILNAARKAEDGLWEFADALLEAVPIAPTGVNNGAIAILTEINNYLKENRLIYKVRTLLQMRLVAKKFPSKERLAGVTFWQHYHSGNTQRLHERLINGESLDSCKNDREKKKYGRYPTITSQSGEIKRLDVLGDRILDLVSASERLARGARPSARIAKVFIAISKGAGRCAAMLSPTRKEYLEVS